MQHNATLLAIKLKLCYNISMRKNNPEIITGRKIAEIAGVSPATVSRVFSGHPGISGSVRSKILRIAADMGFEPNKNKKAKTIALILPEPIQSLDIYFDLILKNLLRELKKDGFMIEMCYSNDLDSINEQIIAGAVSIEVRNKIALNWARQRNIPLVCLNDFNYQLGGIFSVCSNDRQGIQCAVEELHRHGHQEIGLIYYSENIKNQHDRYKIYNEFVKHYHLHGIGIKMEDAEDFDRIAGRIPDKVTALILTDESKGVRLLHQLKQSGLRIPEDISLVVWEIPLMSCYLDPPLTAVGQNFPELARQAKFMLKQLIAGNSPDHDVLVDYQFFPRRSVKTLNH